MTLSLLSHLFCFGFSFIIKVLRKRRMMLANRSYLGLSRQNINNLISGRAKVTFYKTLIRPVRTSSSETWIMSKKSWRDATSLCERFSGGSKAQFERARFWEEERIRNYNIFSWKQTSSKRSNLAGSNGRPFREDAGWGNAQKVHEEGVHRVRRAGRPILRKTDGFVKMPETTPH